LKTKKAYPSILIILTYVIAQFLPVLFILFAPEEMAIDANVYGSMLSFAAGAIVMLIINHRHNFHTSMDRAASVSIGRIVLWGIIGMFMAIFAQNIANWIEVRFLNQTMESANTQALVEIVQNYPLFLILTSIAGPIMEEFVFRKVLFGVLMDYIGVIGGAVVSALLFAFIHFDGHILLYSSMAFVFCYLYYRTKSIWTPILAHALMNTLAVLANIALQNLPQ